MPPSRMQQKEHSIILVSFPPKPKMRNQNLIVQSHRQPQIEDQSTK